MEGSVVNIDQQVKNLLYNKFNHRRVDSVINHFVKCIEGFEENDWEKSLFKAGKFIEAIVKMLWIYCKNTLPSQRQFKASLYAQKVINEVDKTNVPHEGIRLQIPRGCIFLYDITSNRGARHDPEEVNPNEMDATLAIETCSWILAEIIRFSSRDSIRPEQAKSLVDLFTRRRYPFFEEIDGRIYIDDSKFCTPLDCAILILYAIYPKRIEIGQLSDLIERHSFEMRGFRWDMLDHYIDIDDDSNVLLRATGRKKAEVLLGNK
jgi:hypothetical protein